MMGWAIGESDGRDIGYGVPATCDYPTCKKKIDRGVSYACGSFRHDGGCGLYFCEKHLEYATDEYGDSAEFCDRCAYNVENPKDWKKFKPPYEPKPDRNVWVRWKLKHHSWKQWRDENPEEVEKMKLRLKRTNGKVKD